MNQPHTYLLHAQGIADGRLSVTGDRAHPAAILLERHADQRLAVLALGAAEHVARHPAAACAQIRHAPGCVLIPGLINAHTHLDLTIIGPRPHRPEQGFARWIRGIRESRPTDPDQIRASVGDGARLSRAGGTLAVGDICGAVLGSPSIIAAEALRDAELAGVSFIEFFAIGRGEAQRTAAALDIVSAHAGRFSGPLTLGLQPHATNTVSPSAFRAALERAAALGVPIATHLAESPEEREFVAHATGPQRTLLEDLDLWTDDLTRVYGLGQTPAAHLAPVLRGSGAIAVHVNQCDDDDLTLLADAGVRVVYCPRASAYFGAERHFGPHRYRDMLAAGIDVAIGTDSIVNLPEGTDRISPLDEIRLLRARDGTPASTLLAMATAAGARLLGLGEAAASLSPGAIPLGVVAVPVDPDGDGDPAQAILGSDSAPRILLE